VQGLEDIDQELIHLQTSINCFIIETNTAEETVQWIVQLVHDTSTDIKHTTVPRVRSGHDTADTWRLMLQQIHGVSAIVATSVVRTYPTLQSLVEAYNALPPADAKELLAQIKISDKRKIGSALSTRIHCTFTCDDPDFKINSALTLHKKRV
jgi:ERCC4-type nuclease